MKNTGKEEQVAQRSVKEDLQRKNVMKIGTSNLKEWGRGEGLLKKELNQKKSKPLTKQGE